MSVNTEARIAGGSFASSILLFETVLRTQKADTTHEEMKSRHSSLTCSSFALMQDGIIRQSTPRRSIRAEDEAGLRSKEQK
jgi:hypothetical protein